MNLTISGKTYLFADSIGVATCRNARCKAAILPPQYWPSVETAHAFACELPTGVDYDLMRFALLAPEDIKLDDPIS